MKQTIIGITTCLDNKGFIREGTEYAYVRREYGKAVRDAGAHPVYLDPSIDPEIAAELCGGIVISGGADIDASLYGAESLDPAANESLERTTWERQLIDACDAQGIPILGICYGQQLLNVHYGGTLYQDIHAECVSALDHGASGGQATHRVLFEEDFLGFSVGDSPEIASRHHQAVKDLAPGFQVVARSEDGLIESIQGHGHYGVQWHAESDQTAASIYGEFVKQCQPEPEALADLLPEPI